MTPPAQPGSDAFRPGRLEYASWPGGWGGLPDAGWGIGPTTSTVATSLDPWQGHRPGETVVNERTALTIPAFWSAVRFLAETIAGLPVDVCRKDGNIRQRVDGHPIETAMNVWANGLSDPAVMRETMLSHAITWGNGYLYVDRDDAGAWTGQLFNLMTDAVRPFRFVGPTGSVEQWYAVWFPATGSATAVRAADMIHVMGPSPDGMVGWPVVGLMAENLRISRAAEAFGAAFFDQGGHLGGTIETDGRLTDEQVRSLRQQIEEKHTGIRNAHKFLLLQGGAKAKTLAMPPDTAQYIETRNLGVTDVCRMLRVFPYYVMDLGRATWGNAAQQAVDTITYSLLPWIRKLEQQLAAKLFTPAERAAGLFVRFNVDALQRGDHVQQLDSTTKRLSCGLTSLDEERALYDLPPLPGGLGQLRTVPVNQQSVERVAAPAPAGGGDDVTPPPPTGNDDPAEAFAAAGQPTPRPSIVDRGHMAPLVRAAADRVAAKVSAATANARAKYPDAASDAGHRDAFARWADGFADEVSGYTARTVQPMLESAHALSPLPADPADVAAQVGMTYAGQIRDHLRGLPDNPDAALPSLSPVLITALCPTP